jgi:hypothetical protein
LNNFIIELTNLRKKISTPNSFKSCYNDLLDLKESIITYINMLNFIKGKITFGKDQYSVKIEFTWMDTIKDSNQSSYQLNLEIYSNLFNLALTNYFISRLIDLENDDEAKLKTIFKNLEFSVGILDQIKTELPPLVEEKEIPLDLSAKYLDFVRIIKIFRLTLFKIFIIYNFF